MNKMKIYFAGLLLIFSFAAFSSNSFAGSVQCQQVFSSEPSSFWQRTKNYGREVRDTKGVRLFLKDSQPSDPTKWKGFLTKNE